MLVDVPTDQLRALVAVVDFGSYTKAAQFLGLSQPTVSTQIKRLQKVLGVNLFDKSTPAVKLTETGELVVNYARRILAMNDQLLHVIKPIVPITPLKIGLPSDFVESALPLALAEFRKRSTNVNIHIRSDISENLLRDLRQDQLDLVVALTLSGPAVEARHYWPEETVWVRGPKMNFDPTERVPLVSYTDGCVYGRLAMAALSRAGIAYEIVFTGTSIVSLMMAVSSGVGVMALARRVVPSGVTIWENAPLPQLPDVICGVYPRRKNDGDQLDRLADMLAEILRPRPGASRQNLL